MVDGGTGSSNPFPGGHCVESQNSARTAAWRPITNADALHEHIFLFDSRPGQKHARHRAVNKK